MHRVLITGDVVVDHHIYEGQRRRATSLMRLGTRHITSRGGARFLADMLESYRQQYPAARQAWIDRARQVARTEAERSHREVPQLDEQELLERFALREISTGFGLGEQDCALQQLLQSCALYRPFRVDAANGNRKVWRLGESLGYGGEDATQHGRSVPHSAALEAPYDVWLLDDGGLGFRHRSSVAAWPPVLRGEEGALPEWIVLKVSAPLGTGDLWHALTRGYSYQADTLLSCGSLSERLVVLVSAEDLRCEQVAISRGISWERTALDLGSAIRDNPSLRRLAGHCRYLVISLGCEGAILVDHRDPQTPRLILIFDPAHLEGDWLDHIEGDVHGKQSCLTTGIVSRLPQARSTSLPTGPHPERQLDEECARLVEGIQTGLTAIRVLMLCGHGPADEQPQLPIDDVAAQILNPRRTRTAAGFNIQPPRFEVIRVPMESEFEPGNRQTWRILEGDPHRLDGHEALTLGGARLLAQLGLPALSGIPYLAMGALKTVDRSEIESLRTIRMLIEQYRNDPTPKRPLSIGVFGQPGSGKSFGVKQIARAVLGNNVPILEFNLSQLNMHDEPVLIGAFHQVRDKVLEGKTPVVFWDEFDAGQLQWLSKLLAPMQDGTFMEGQSSHPIGKCIFVFAGGTSYDFDSFGPPESSDDLLTPEEQTRLMTEQQAFKLAKGPDFKSRLTAFLNVAGPNRRKDWNWRERRHQVDWTDTGFPIRRALLLRSQLGLEDGQPLDIDPPLLTALLETREYRHGARSMEKVLTELKSRSRGGRLRLSHLPPDDVLNLHVDAADFHHRLERDFEFQRTATEIAPHIHAAYLEQITSSDHDAVERVRRNFDQLPPDVQEDNLAAARRMPNVLAVAGLELVRANESHRQTDQAVLDRIEALIVELSEAEHNGWMEHKYLNDWTYAPIRNDALKQHDCLRPFVHLPPAQQEKDAHHVRRYPEFAQSAGYRIVFTDEERDRRRSRTPPADESVSGSENE